ncbi:MAG: PH domain-containing protein, partial [Planctomycetota bacterium]
QGHPSQILNTVPNVILVLLLGLLGVGLWYASRIPEDMASGLLRPVARWALIAVMAGIAIKMLVRYIRYRVTTYHITDGHLEITTGLLSRHTEMIECYRIRDIEIHRPLHLRLFGLGHIDIVSSDRTAPDVRLAGLKDCVAITRRLRQEVERCRMKARVMGLDADNPGAAME